MSFLITPSFDYVNTDIRKINRTKIYDIPNLLVAFVFDAEALLLLKHRGILRMDIDGFHQSGETGKITVHHLKHLPEVSRQEPSNTVIKQFEILVPGPLTLAECLDFIEDAAVDYNSHQPPVS